MTALPPEVRRAAEPVGVGGFEIGYVTDDGLEHRVSLSQAWATPKGQRHLSGCGGQPQPVATRGLSPGWNTITLVQEAVRRAHAHHRDS